MDDLFLGLGLYVSGKIKERFKRVPDFGTFEPFILRPGLNALLNKSVSILSAF